MNALRTKRSRGLRVWVVGLASALVVTACGDSSGSTEKSDELETWSSLGELEAAAKKEGTVAISVTTEYAEFIVPGFKEAYPWAKVELTQLGPPEAAAKWTAELQAGVNEVDVLALRTGHLPQFAEAGAVARIHVPNDELVPESLRDEDNYTHPLANNPLTLFYNTSLVDAGPEHVADLADPEWKDKLVMQSPSLQGNAGQLLAGQREAMGDDAWREWLQEIADNNPQLTDSDSTSYATVLRGDRPLCICAMGDFLGQAPGTPIGNQWYDQDGQGVLTGPVIMVAAEKAPHPAMAALLINWILDPEGGQKGVAESSRVPAVPVPGADKVNIPDDVKQADYYSVMGDYLENTDDYTEVYTEIFGQ